MREIKFRAWDKNNKTFTPINDIVFEIDGGIRQISTHFMEYGIDEEDFDLEDLVLMQYTCLKDKNGNEIYEGDIVRLKVEQYGFDDTTLECLTIEGIVRWNYLGFDIQTSEINGKPVFDSIIQEMILGGHVHNIEWEVIGNIYENPELLGDVTKIQ